MGAKTIGPAGPSKQENELRNLDVQLARELAGSSLGGNLLDILGQTSSGIQGFLQNPFALSPAQEQLLQQQANQQLGQLLGNATSRGLGASSIAGGAIGGLASGLVGQRFNMGLQNVQALSQLQDQALKNRLLLQQSVESPWQALADLRFKTAQLTKRTGGLGGIIGGVIGTGLGALTGGLGAGIGGALGRGLLGGVTSGGGGGGGDSQGSFTNSDLFSPSRFNLTS